MLCVLVLLDNCLGLDDIPCSHICNILCTSDKLLSYVRSNSIYIHVRINQNDRWSNLRKFDLRCVLGLWHRQIYVCLCECT